jgi:hypothetical protein
MVHIVMLFIYHWRFLCAVFFSCCVEAFFASTAGSSSVMRFGWNHRRLERKEHGNANVCVTSINVLVTVQKSITGLPSHIKQITEPMLWSWVQKSITRSRFAFAFEQITMRTGNQVLSCMHSEACWICSRTGDFFL